jgi:chorismate synthase
MSAEVPEYSSISTGKIIQDTKRIDFIAASHGNKTIRVIRGNPHGIRVCEKGDLEYFENLHEAGQGRVRGRTKKHEGDPLRVEAIDLFQIR